MARHSATTQRTRPKPGHGSTNPMTQCAKVCNETLAYCLEQGGDHVEPEHLKALIDCAEICTMAATLHDRQSALHRQAMALCAEACKACEESCEGFEGDATMQACADACRECYEHCSNA